MERRSDLRIRAEMTPLIVKGIAKAVTGGDPSEEARRLTELSAERRESTAEADE